MEYSSATLLNDGDQVNQTNISAKEKLKKVDLPLTLSYSFGKGSFNYVLRLGGMISYITDASLLPARSQADFDAPAASSVDISQNRQQLYYAAVAGLGFEYKVPRGFLVLDLRYHFGFQNIVIGANRYNNPELLSKYMYIDSDFALDYLSIGIGYHFSMYQSKKNRY